MTLIDFGLFRLRLGSAFEHPKYTIARNMAVQETESKSQGLAVVNLLLSIIRTGLVTGLVGLSLLTFPEFLPLMVLFWMLVFTCLAVMKKKGWFALLICSIVLVSKGVPLLPSTILICGTMLAVASFRWKVQDVPAWNALHYQQNPTGLPCGSFGFLLQNRLLAAKRTGRGGAVPQG